MSDGAPTPTEAAIAVLRALLEGDAAVVLTPLGARYRIEAPAGLVQRGRRALRELARG